MYVLIVLTWLSGWGSESTSGWNPPAFYTFDTEEACHNAEKAIQAMKGRSGYIYTKCVPRV